MSFFSEGINSLRQVSFEGGGNNDKSVKDIAEKLLFKIENAEETDVDSIADEYAELKLTVDRANKEEIDKQIQEAREKLLKNKIETENQLQLKDLYEKLINADSEEARNQITAEIEALQLDYLEESSINDLKNTYENKINDLQENLNYNLSPKEKAEFSELFDKLKAADGKDEMAQIFAELEEFGQRSGIAEDPKFNYSVNNAKADINYTTDIRDLYEALAETETEEGRTIINTKIQQLQLEYQMEKKTIQLRYEMDRKDEALKNRSDEDISKPDFHTFG